jgi:hypothetical protein
MNDDGVLVLFGMIIGAVIASILCLVLIKPWAPGGDMECNPGSHAIQTSNANHHRWYDCQPITP